jgi:hypothetical protein
VNNTAIVNILLGIVLLFLGRRLFWFFAGVAGFLVGMNLAEQFVVGPQGTKLLIAIIAGIIGAVIAIYLRKVAVAIAGFIIGGYITVELLREFALFPPAFVGAHTAGFSIPYIIGGIIGAVLLFMLFDWALIILSSLSGASLIVHSVTLQGISSQLLFVLLVIVGILVQAGIMRMTRAPAR